ncbi:MAG TPA: hypothetical protein VH062_14900 [Polyangiaceae bacterium]|nr:hypothetical protein [Polyangiaceae bacterium]
MTVAPSSCAWRDLNMPPARPTGVRSGSQMTVSRMKWLLAVSG